MKIYLADNYKIYSYSLPDKIEDAFIINYQHYSGIDETITLIADNNQWTIESTSDIKYKKDNTDVYREKLVNGSIYNIIFSDLKEIITLYCFDKNQDFFEFDIPTNKNEIILGNNNTCDIMYDNLNISTPELKIYKQNNAWILEDNGYDKTKTFVNNKRVRKAQLKLGDIIFTNGLKIIWLETFFKLNNPNNAIKTSLKKRTYYADDNINTYTPVKDTEKSITLYNDDQVFFHTPRLKEDIIEKEIEIERPPQAIGEDQTPAILSIGATAVMGFSSVFTGFSAIIKVSTGKQTFSEASTEIILCIAMVLGCILFPVLLDKYNRKKTRSKEKNRQDTYHEYLDSLQKEIDIELEKEKKILLDNYIDPEELKNQIKSKSNKIWSREISDNDFLILRLGLGDKKPAINISISKKAYDMEKDALNIEAQKLAEKELVLQQVPITISLVDNTILPFVISNDYKSKQQFVNYLLLQLISQYSGNDLKIIIFTTENNNDQWDFIKYLPHLASESRKFRFYAETEEESKQVSTYLEKIYNKRLSEISHQQDNNLGNEDNNTTSNKNSSYTAFDTYYLIITDNYISAKRYGIIQSLLDNKENLGFSLITIEPTMQNIPSKCENIVVINNENGEIISKSLNKRTNNSFIPDCFNDNIKPYSNIIANIPLSTESINNKLPKTLPFLEMLKIGKIEQLNILNRWTKNDPTLSLTTPIGVHEDGKVFELDLHEKFHGPHGLIAGSTGSGKSELIITFILSMAINYHPYEVQFVLIDYKGGGLAGAFENKESKIKLPHLVGTITNLDTNEMNRTLVSINSELKRRQRIFNEARDSLNESTVDIYKYQKFYREGKVKEPISHLFIISDEFAELKAQQPEFMNSLVSTARIGRSLGVHLILATQKPSGVVDDQIWSNSRFKICLKVATAEDSRELLKRPEAAEIKEAGRFYLQVGFNELFELGQSGWAGARYNPTDHIIKNIDDSIEIIDNIGTTIKSINDSKEETQQNLGDQLTNIVKFIHTIALRENVDVKSMWLPSIPTEIYLSNLIKKYNHTEKRFYINPIIGEYDDPERQYQGKYAIDFMKDGNILIYGVAGSGKENLITTMLFSICTAHKSDEVNIYIIDLGAETLKIFNEMPQVGDVALSDDKEKVKGLLLMIDRELIKRKEAFSEFGGNYIDYNKKNDNKLPMIVVILNGWESFCETYPDYVDIISHITRECNKYGIVFITSMVNTNSMISGMQQNFQNKIALQLADEFDYRFIMEANNGLVPKKAFSRGLTHINGNTYEFQGAYIYYKEKINDLIKEIGSKIKNTQKKAIPIPVIPDTITVDTLAPYISELSTVPIGYNIFNAKCITFDFDNNKVTQIIGNYIVNDKAFLIELLRILNIVQDTKLRIFDFIDAIDNSDEFENYTNDEFTAAINNIITIEQTENKKNIYVMVGIGRIYDKVLDEGIDQLFAIFKNIDKFKNSRFILLDNYSTFKKIMKEDWYSRLNNNIGIWVGTEPDNQTAIRFNNIAKSDINENFAGITYISNTDEYYVLKSIGSRPEEEY